MENLLFGANAPFSIIFSKSIQNLTFFFLNFSMLSKKRKLCHDIKVASGVKGKVLGS